MSSNHFALSNVQFHDPAAPSSATIYNTLKLLKRDILSLRNRLRSIATDAAYVVELQDSLIASAQPVASPRLVSAETAAQKRGTWPLIANERNGSWYIPRERKRGSAYFKSTDGHQGQWGFSLRRLNLGVLDLLGECNCAILVDSTRTGKIFPDALSKTVPIWTAIINAALFPTSITSITTSLQTPPSFSSTDPAATYLSPSEISSISSRLPQFLASLHNLSLPLDVFHARLGAKPIKLVWAVHGSPHIILPAIAPEDFESFNVLVLCSASRRVRGVETSEGGYVQGAADDAEGWSGGLSGEGFWEVVRRGGLEEELGESDLRVLAEDVTKKLRGSERHEGEGWVVEVAEGLFVGRMEDMQSERNSDGKVLMVVCNGISPSERKGKGKLANGAEDIHDEKSVDGGNGLHQPRNQVYLELPTGSRKLPVDGRPAIDKNLVRKRLAWIVEKMDESRTSRATLNAVNEFLIGR